MNNLTLEQQAKYASFRECFIEYQQISDIYAIFDRLVLNSSFGGEQQSMLLTGDTGSGKSALIDHYVSRRTKPDSRWSVLPVLKTGIPSQIHEKNMLERFLQDLDSQVSVRARRGLRAASLEKSVINHLQRKKVRLIVVNEVQELIEFKDAQDRQAIVNTFKMISEQAKVSFVLVGMPYANLLADEAQWSSRLGWRRSIDYFRLFKRLDSSDAAGVDGAIKTKSGTYYLADLDGKRHFAKFVAGLASRMGFEQKPNLTSNDILLPLFATCRGECRALKHFLADALLSSFQESKSTIDKPLLAQTYDFKFPDVLSNPFNCRLEDLEIVELAKQTDYNYLAKKKEDRIINQSFTDILPIELLLSKKPLKPI
ncbi:putative transposition protein [Vibrio variabilis]|uniref:Transposition protein n=1 Tax=Vibrio variabilis TaxID=990271 RepID=A0ABQ0JNS2_9VIBR|nr:putative transposition protein [Vibrio variabilis]